MPKLTITVAVYNAEKYLEKCIDSILSQTYTDYECILVNDGSTDQSGAICERYALKDNRIRVVHQENAGLAATRNKGLELAKGEFIYFMDNDDYLEKDAMACCVEKLVNDNSQMVIFDVFQYQVATNTVEIIKNPFDENRVYNIKEEKDILVKILNATWNKMYRVNLFTNNAITFPEEYFYEDFGTTYRLLAVCQRISFINKPLYHYLVDRPGNITTQFNRRVYDVLDLIKINNDFYKEKGIYEIFYEELKYLGIINVLECLKKVRNGSDKEMIKAYVAHAYAFLKHTWPEYPKCQYEINRQKNDIVYIHPMLLKLYLFLKKGIL